MKLSMWILAEWLKEYTPRVLIKKGERILTGARLFTDGMHTDPASVYIASMSDYVDTESSCVMCVSGEDMIILDTDDISEAFNAVMAAFDYHSRWSDALKELVLDGCSLDELLEAAYETFKSPLVVADPAFAVKARIGMREPYLSNLNIDSVIKNGTMLLNTIMELNNDKRLRRRLAGAYYYNSKQQGFPTLIKNLFCGGEHIGWLVIITDEDPPGTACTHMFEELGDIAELYFSLNPQKNALPTFDEILPGILSEAAMSPGAFNYFSLLGWEKNDEKILYIIASACGRNAFGEIRSRLDNYLHGSAIAIYNGSPVIIINTRLLSKADSENYLRHFLGQTGSYCVKSAVFSDCSRITDYYNICLKMLSICAQETGVIYSYERLAVACAASIVRENSPAPLTHGALRMLSEYDTANNTTFYETLKVYLLCERNYVKTAQRLYIHRNSLVYRIKRIEEITQLNLDDDYTRLHVLMSYYI